MASSLFARLQGWPQSISTHPLIQNHSTALVTLAALSGPLLRLLYISHADYRAWLRVGRGGLPYNAFGWLIQLLLTPLRGPRLDTGCYDSPKAVAKAGPQALVSYLEDEDIPERQGPRPSICHWLLPQRQLDSQSSEGSKTRRESFMRSLAEADPTRLSVNTSALERGGLALFVNSDVEKHPSARWTKNEIAHLHPGDGSMHVSIAPLDAKLVIERGWGERFGLGGTLLPATYIMVYAPKSGENEEAETAVVEKIINAGMKFMLGERKE